MTATETQEATKRARPADLEKIASRTVPFEAACREIGIPYTTGCEAAREDRFPVPVIRIGRRMYVSRAALDKLLG